MFNSLHWLRIRVVNTLIQSEWSIATSGIMLSANQNGALLPAVFFVAVKLTRCDTNEKCKNGGYENRVPSIGHSVAMSIDRSFCSNVY